LTQGQGQNTTKKTQDPCISFMFEESLPPTAQHVTRVNHA
jgi:hypothetical protein